MKDFKIINFNQFIEKTSMLETPLKFFQRIKGNEIRAECFLRTHVISFEGEIKPEDFIELHNNDYAEAEILDTKKVEVWYNMM